MQQSPCTVGRALPAADCLAGFQSSSRDSRPRRCRQLGDLRQKACDNPLEYCRILAPKPAGGGCHSNLNRKMFPADKIVRDMLVTYIQCFRLSTIQYSSGNVPYEDRTGTGTRTSENQGFMGSAQGSRKRNKQRLRTIDKTISTS